MHLLRNSLFALVLTLAVTVTQVRAAEDHVVPQVELQQKVLEQSRSREQDLTAVRRLLSSADRELRKARIDPVKVEQALSLLDDRELAGLAARAQKAQRDFAAGALNNQQLTYIIIALATAVIILVIVAA